VHTHKGVHDNSHTFDDEDYLNENPKHIHLDAHAPVPLPKGD